MDESMNTKKMSIDKYKKGNQQHSAYKENGKKN